MKTIWEEIEERLIEKIMEKLEEKKPQPGESKDYPERDPYLVPDAPCEVWEDGDKQLRYFAEYGPDGDLRFKISTERDVNGRTWSNYRVLGTVWDYAPDWAEWVAIGPYGANVFFETEPERDTSGWFTDDNYLRCGSADPADWENSLRRRPKWAFK